MKIRNQVEKFQNSFKSFLLARIFFSESDQHEELEVHFELHRRPGDDFCRRKSSQRPPEVERVCIIVKGSTR